MHGDPVIETLLDLYGSILRTALLEDFFRNVDQLLQELRRK